MNSKQTRAVGHLAEGWTVGQVAKEIGVSERQVFRWKTNPEFDQAVRSLQADTLARTKGRLLALVDKAVDALSDLLDRPGQDAGWLRRLVAVSVLEQLSRVTQTVDFETRLLELEREVKHGK